MSKVHVYEEPKIYAAIVKTRQWLREKNWGPPSSLLSFSDYPSPPAPRLPYWEDLVKVEDTVPMRVRVHFMELQVRPYCGSVTDWEGTSRPSVAYRTGTAHATARIRVLSHDGIDAR